MAAKTKRERQLQRRREGRGEHVRHRAHARKVKPPPRRGVRVETDPQMIKRMASLGCSQWEIATILGVAERTLRDRLENDPETRRAYLEGQIHQYTELRRLQWKHAKGKNGTAMTIHMSKHVLNQHDKSLIMNLTVDDLDALISEMERRNATQAIEGPPNGGDAGELNEAAPAASTPSRK